MQKILVTGSSGFIGFHLSKRLLGQGNSVVGIDNLNEYYDVNLKKSRLNELKGDPEFIFHKLDLVDRNGIEKIFSENRFDYVVNLDLNMFEYLNQIVFYDKLTYIFVLVFY